MSCQNKRVNIEKYANPPRTPFDQLMNKVYNTADNYHAAPYPMPRTDFDIKMQQHWCPKCGHGFSDMDPQGSYPKYDPNKSYPSPAGPYY